MKKTIFTKYSTERCDKFAIKTLVTAENEVKRVEKYPATPQAQQHIEKMADNCHKINSFYSGAGFRAAECVRIDGGVAFEFINGITFEEQLENVEKQQGFQALVDMLKQLYSKLMGCEGVKPFVRTPEFDAVFGTANLPDGLNAMDFCCFDLAFGNLIINETTNIIDYEWCFDFPVPIEYIFYRAVKLFVVLNGRNDLIDNNIYARLGFDEQLAAAFDKLETDFQSYVRQGAFCLRDLYKGFDTKSYSLAEIIDMQQEEKPYAQVYFSSGNDYSEADSYREEVGERAEIAIHFTQQGADKCRFDPFNSACIMEIYGITALCDDGEYTPDFVANGTAWDSFIVFDNDDPQMYFNGLKEGTKRLVISYAINPLGGKAAALLCEGVQNTSRVAALAEELRQVQQLAQDRQQVIEMTQNHVENITGIFNAEKDALQAEISKAENEISMRDEEILRQQQYIASIENSKAWKLVLKARKLLGKG